jgi:hypothetical protein
VTQKIQNHILTGLPPRHRGEEEVFRQISAQPFKKIWFWFALDFIPGVADIDMLVWSESAGLVAVEIKSLPIGMVKSLSYQTCEITGRGLQRSPQLQAYEAAQSLRLYLQPLVSRVPYISATVCWPQISRDEWKTYFRANSDIANLSDKFLMRDDLYSTPTVLTERLGEIVANPPCRKAPEKPYAHDSRVFDEVSAVINPSAAPNVSQTDLDRLRKLESGMRRDVVKLFPPAQARRVVFRGKPGTGKTYRLFQVGVLFAKEGRRALLTCFNKVLASEFRRSLNLMFRKSMMETLATDTERNQLEAIDIFGLAKRIVSDLNIQLNPQVDDFDEWGELVTSAYSEWLSNNETALYDAVLIDEAQDFKKWQMELALMLVKPSGTVVIGYGGEQELYSGTLIEGDFLAELTNNFKTIELKRNFRNAPPIYKLAHLVLDCAFDVKKLDSSYEKTFARRKRSDAEVEFEIQENRYPNCFYVDDLSIDIASDTYKADRDILIVHRYADVIRDALSRMPPDLPRRELLLLVPTGGEEANYVRDALDLVKVEDPSAAWIDYVKDDMRGSSSPEQMIRIVSYHSSRGLDAFSTVVFGIDSIHSSCPPRLAPEKLAHIVLSRSIFETTIVFRTARSGIVSEFLSSALEYLRGVEK